MVRVLHGSRQSEGGRGCFAYGRRRGERSGGGGSRGAGLPEPRCPKLLRATFLDATGWAARARRSSVAAASDENRPPGAGARRRTVPVASPDRARSSAASGSELRHDATALVAREFLLPT